VQLPVWLYALVVLAMFAQLGGFALLVINIKGHISALMHSISPVAAWLGAFATVALGIKLLLQALSAIPSLNQTVFGFRPIVIGYLHLVFLGIVTLFIFSHCIAENHILATAKAIKSIYLFTAGIIINEALLMLQGVCDLFYTNVPLINEALLAAALVMFVGILATVISQFGQPVHMRDCEEIYAH
jgi:hypothetical protein